MQNADVKKVKKHFCIQENKYILHSVWPCCGGVERVRGLSSVGWWWVTGAWSPCVHWVCAVSGSGSRSDPYPDTRYPETLLQSLRTQTHHQTPATSPALGWSSAGPTQPRRLNQSPSGTDQTGPAQSTGTGWSQDAGAPRVERKMIFYFFRFILFIVLCDAGNEQCFRVLEIFNQNTAVQK